jgi:hypothetical protein
MNFNYTLKYRTFDQLMADARVDLKTFDLDNKIQPAELIKVATRVNYDLGLRIQQPKDYIIEIEKGKGKLPDDFNVMNYAYICGDPETPSIIPPQGTHTESLNPMTGVVPQYRAFPDSTNCGCPNNQKICMEWNKNQPVVIQKINTIQLPHTSSWRYFRKFFQVHFTNSKFINCECPNLSHISHDQAYIKDSFVWTNLDCGHLYINYEGAMEDSDGNLLVPDHPLLNEYYEYAIKQRILENLLMAGESVTAQIQIVEQRYRAARNNALTMVNTPNFSEMQKLWVANRLAQYSKYYDMFKSYPGQMRSAINNAV